MHRIIVRRIGLCFFNVQVHANSIQVFFNGNIKIQSCSLEMNHQQKELLVTRDVLNAFVNWVDLIKSGLCFVLF